MHYVVTRVPTGIEIIDKMLGGGFERGSSILLRSSPFVDATPIAQEILYNRLTKRDKGLYVINNRPPETVLEEMKHYGWPVKPYWNKGFLSFVDAYSGIMGLGSSEEFSVKNPLDPQEVNETVLEALKAKGEGTIVLFDSLNTLIDQCGPRILSNVEGWRRYCLAYDISGIYIYTEWGYPDDVRSKIEHIFDTVIDLKALKRIVASEVLTVTKVDGKPLEKRRFTPFKYAKPGGLKVYVPKILVTGPYHAGKTTIVHALSSRAVSVQRMGTTIALDFGHVEYKGFSVDLFGTVGQPRFDPILEVLGGDSLGVILVVDSTKPEEFPRAIEMMHKSGVYGLPYVVVANKQDLPNALSADEIRRRMHIPEDVPVIETVATEKKNVIKALDALLKKLIEEG